jgi:hypothetical protein
MDINNINNYSQLIYPMNNEVRTLHQILLFNEETSTRFSTMVLQEIIDFNSREFADLTEYFIKRVIKFSIPLGILICTFVGLHLIEPISLLT